MRSCGKCVHFVKIKNNIHVTGLCDAWDIRAISDGGKKCDKFKRVKYDRRIHPKSLMENDSENNNG